MIYETTRANEHECGRSTQKIHAFCDKWIKKMEYYLAGKQQNAI